MVLAVEHGDGSGPFVRIREECLIGDEEGEKGDRDVFYLKEDELE